MFFCPKCKGIAVVFNSTHGLRALICSQCFFASDVEPESLNLLDLPGSSLFHLKQVPTGVITPVFLRRES